MTEGFSIIITSVPDSELAEKIARLLVEKKLAACVNILSEATSVYCWKEAITSDKEYILMIKTLAANYYQIEEIIRANHSYELPEIISFKIDCGEKNYLSWLKENSQK